VSAIDPLLRQAYDALRIIDAGDDRLCVESEIALTDAIRAIEAAHPGLANGAIEKRNDEIRGKT
jgi:hypothetical protein